jgi:Tc5 transposase DNA-binding domain/CENP-B N-terminal DNA-binding domain
VKIIVRGKFKMPLVKEKVCLKRKAVTLEVKIKMLDRLREGEKLGTVAKKFNLNESTVRTIRDNEEKIRSNVVVDSANSAKRVCRTRNPVMEIMEKAVMIWIEDNTQRRIPMSGLSIKHKALSIYKKLMESGSSGSDHQFSASNGWLDKFKHRFNLHNLKLTGESASADTEAQKQEAIEMTTKVDNLENLENQSSDEDEAENQSSVLSIKDLKEMCELAAKLESYAEKENSEQVQRLAQQIRIAIAPLQERLKEKQKQAKQP